MGNYTEMSRENYPNTKQDRETKLTQQEIVLGSVRVQLGASPTGANSITGTLCKNFTIQASAGNSGTVYIGGSGVTTSNHIGELSGGSSMDFDLWDTGMIWVTGTSGDVVLVSAES